jgi:hypothetical protein
MSGPKPTEQHLECISSPDPDVLPDKHAAVDEELRRYVVAAGSVEVDEATSKRLRRLIDKRVLIVMVGTYFLQSLDKNAISFAAIMGIQKDAHLVGQDVSSSAVLF